MAFPQAVYRRVVLVIFFDLVERKRVYIFERPSKFARYLPSRGIHDEIKRLSPDYCKIDPLAKFGSGGLCTTSLIAM